MSALPNLEPGRSHGVHPAHRGSIFLEDGQIISQETWPGEQFVLRISAPKCAARALPGSFVHLPAIPTCRCAGRCRFSASMPARAGSRFSTRSWARAARAEPSPHGDALSVLGPIGQPFRPDPKRPRALLVGGGVGIPPMVFLAEWMLEQAGKPWKPLVLMGSEIPFPFKARPSTILVPGIPPAPSQRCRCSTAGACPAGWRPGPDSRMLRRLRDPARGRVVRQPRSPRQKRRWKYSPAAPPPCSKPWQRSPPKHGVPCQVSLEEFMACAVGGCAGCTVKVNTPDGPAMKRVCVDGPVFDSRAVFG